MVTSRNVERKRSMWQDNARATTPPSSAAKFAMFFHGILLGWGEEFGALAPKMWSVKCRV